MVLTSQSDTPTATDRYVGKPLVGLRMPYNLPLKRYVYQDSLWVAKAEYSKPDRKGMILLQ